jgi:hypothetical protein
MVCDISKPVVVLMSSSGCSDSDSDNPPHDHNHGDWPDGNDLISPVGRQVAHRTTLLFCLSAIAPPLDMQQACCNVASTLRPGGVLVVRDYGRYDQAQLKLARSNKNCCGVGVVGGSGDRRRHCPPLPCQDYPNDRPTRHSQDHSPPLPALCVSTPDYNKHWYRKHDGTCCYYFTTDDLIQLFQVHAGLMVLECRYIRRVYRNQATGELRRRIWVQGRFQNPKPNPNLATTMT